MIRVFIIANSPLFQPGVESLLKTKAITVSGTATDVALAAAQLSYSGTDVILIDAAGQHPEELVHFLIESDLARDLPVIVLADHLVRTSWAALVRAGIRGALPSDISQDQLLCALEAVVCGLIVMNPEDVETTAAATAQMPLQVRERLEPLTRREYEVLQMLTAGLSNKEIALRLNMSEHTVKFHVATILGKLGAENRTEAVSLAIRQGLVFL